MGNLKKTITVSNPAETRKVWLRTASVGDLSNLRRWKNEQREFFFYKGEISSEQQHEWFRAYEERPEDYMFVVFVEEVAIGCMGIRLIEDAWDIYNVILGSLNYGGNGLMSKAFQAMLLFAASRYPNPITLQVLKHNPAIGWYQKNGFRITSEHSDYFCMSYQSKNIAKDIS